jgi:hypothetical protein
MSVTELASHDLVAAYYNGLRQIGDMDTEVAADLGYAVDSDAFAQHVSSGQEVAALTSEASATERDAKIGGFVCGDCLQIAPCLHISEDKNGIRRSIG